MEKHIFDGLENSIINNSINQDDLEKELSGEVITPTTTDESDKDDKSTNKEVTLGFSQEELESEFAKDADNEDPNNTDATNTDDDSRDTGNNNTNTADENTGEESEDNVVYKFLSEKLKTAGLTDVDFSTEDELVSSLSNVIKAENQKFIDSQHPDVKSIIEKYQAGVPLDELIKNQSETARLESINAEDLDDAETAKEIIRKHYKETTKFNSTRIEKDIARLEDLGELTDTAAENLAELKEIQIEKNKLSELEASKRIEVERKNYQETINKLNDVVKNTKEILPGIKITDKDRQELFSMIVNPVETRGNDSYTAAMIQREKDPIDFELKLNYFIKQGFFDGKFDAVMKKAENKVVSKLEKSVEEIARAQRAKGGDIARLESKGTAADILKGYASTYKR